MFLTITFVLRNRFAMVLLSCLFITISCSAPMTSSSGARQEKSPPSSEKALSKSDIHVRYIVQLVDPPLAGYGGGIPGLEPTNPAITGQKLNQRSPGTQAYLAYLAEKQALFKKRAEQLLKREVGFEKQFAVVINAVVMTMTPDEALKISELPDVRSVEPDRQLKLHPESPDEVHGLSK